MLETKSYQPSSIFTISFRPVVAHVISIQNMKFLVCCLTSTFVYERIQCCCISHLIVKIKINAKFSVLLTDSFLSENVLY
jgi:hypothetical protein